MASFLRPAFTAMAILLAQVTYGGVLRDSAMPLLEELNAALAACIDTDAASPDCGAIRCPACGEYHTRAAEAVWPLAYEASLTGNEERFRQAVMLGDWLVARQNRDGSWYETPDGRWTGTTTDQLLSLLLAYPLLQKGMSGKQKHAWRASMRGAADYLVEVMDNRFAYINYCATTSASLALYHSAFGGKKYLEKAQALAALCIGNMDSDALLEGEGDNAGDVKKGVDIGYNMEMSLWGLAEYASLTEDAQVWDAVVSSACRHLHFIYPDGTLDASAGLRSGKWILCGGSTSDGCHPLFALLSGEVPAFASAAVRNIAKLRECLTASGLVGSGTDYDGMRESPPCIYHTFAKAKSLAMALAWVKDDPEELVALPCDADTSVLYEGLRTAIVRNGGFRGTVCAYGYKSAKGGASKFMHRPSGGAMTLLWADEFGLVQAGSQSEYHRWEASFPDMPPMLPLTPRIESADGRFSNPYEFEARLEMEGDASCRVGGVLKDRDQTSSGVTYGIEYSFGEDCLIKTYSFAGGDVRIVEPVIVDEGTQVRRVDASTVSFTRGGQEITVSTESDRQPLEIDWAAAEMTFQLFPAVKALPLTVTPPVGDTVNVVFRIKRDVDENWRK